MVVPSHRPVIAIVIGKTTRSVGTPFKQKKHIIHGGTGHGQSSHLSGWRKLWRTGLAVLRATRVVPAFMTYREQWPGPHST